MSLSGILPIFFKVGLFTIGGGLAAVPVLHEVVLDQGWMDNEQFLSVIAVSESTPGSIGVNMATYIGVDQFGVIGGVLATFALVLPSLLIITTIARFFPQFSSIPVVKSALSGVRPAVTGLIATAVFTLGVNTLLTAERELNIYATLFFLLFVFLHDRFKWNPPALIVTGALCGVIFF